MCGTPHAHGHTDDHHDPRAGDPRLFFDKEIAPDREIAPGETIVVDTLDCTGGLIKSESDVIESLDELGLRLG
jgi:acetamidase/formamidase